MKSNLKRIYDIRNGYDIFNQSSYHFKPNPIYQVNKFITEFDEGLNKNLICNLENLNIKNSLLCDNCYDYENNTLFCKDAKGDVFGLLHVASNDKDKKYTGIIFEDGVGYGLNQGLTEVYTKDINNKKIVYPFEAIIAKTLLMLNCSIMTYSYFNNEGSNLLLIDKNIKELMKYLDEYHDNYIKMTELFNVTIFNKFRKLKTPEQEQRIMIANNNIHQLKYANFNCVYNIFCILIDIIKNSNLIEDRKQELLCMLNYEFSMLFEEIQFFYLNNLTTKFKNNINVKKKVK